MKTRTIAAAVSIIEKQPRIGDMDDVRKGGSARLVDDDRRICLSAGS
jgi:hypothetical protein